MTILTDSVLIESKSARDEQLSNISPERAAEILGKVKTLYFALWQGTSTAVTDQIANFYEVPEANLRKLLKTHREEFASDGLKAIRGKALSDARNLWSLPSRTSQVTIWTPRAVLRAGMLMRDSKVAKAVRTSLLDAVGKVIPAQANRIRELELELQVAQAQQAAAAAQHQATTAQNQLVASCSALAIINPALPALVLGKPDAVMTHREIVQETVLVNAQGKAIASYLGYSKTKLAKRYGMKKPQDLVNWLQSIGRVDVLQPGLTATPCQYVPYELVHELDALWMQQRGVRQRLIGE